MKVNPRLSACTMIVSAVRSSPPCACSAASGSPSRSQCSTDEPGKCPPHWYRRTLGRSWNVPTQNSTRSSASMSPARRNQDRSAPLMYSGTLRARDHMSDVEKNWCQL